MTLAAPAAVSDRAEEHGIEFLALPESRLQELLEAEGRWGPLGRIRDRPRRLREAIEATGVRQFTDVVRRHEPDLLLIDCEMHEHVVAASSGPASVALLSSFVATWKAPGLPPPHHLVRPGVGWRGSGPGIELLWAQLRARKAVRAAVARTRHLGCDRLSVLRALAREHGFDFRSEVDFSQWPIPLAYRRLPLLCLHALEFEFPHLPPPHVRHLGPLVLRDGPDRRVDAADRDRLGALAARRSSGSTLIYAGFGSFLSVRPELVRNLATAVAERPDWELVLSWGGQEAPLDARELPANVHAFRWVPQVDVLRHADLAVIHGGIGTVDECVMASVPMLVYCGFETDMPGTTARVAHHGLGIVGDDRDSAPAIRRHLERLLAEPGWAVRVARLRRRYLRYVEEGVAEAVIDSLLAGDLAPADGVRVAGSVAPGDGSR